MGHVPQLPPRATPAGSYHRSTSNDGSENSKINLNFRVRGSSSNGLTIAAVVTEAFKLAVLQYRVRGGKLYQLAQRHRISPTLLSATITGARRCDYDARIVAIGVELGVNPDDVFVPDEAESIAS